MHPFSSIENLPSFEGDAIAQVWLDPYGVRFLFESELGIYAEHGIEHIEADGTIWWYECDASKGGALVLQRLLYKRVLVFEREHLRLIFRFEDGQSLTILSDEGLYESGHIHSKDGMFIVF